MPVIDANILRIEDERNKIPSKKTGLYRWWAKESELRELLEKHEPFYEELKQHMHKKKIDNVEYFHIYTGIAKKTIKGRLYWHIELHSNGYVKNKTISTLRYSISSLLFPAVNLYTTKKGVDIFMNKLKIEYDLESDIKKLEEQEKNDFENRVLPLNIRSNENPKVKKFKKSKEIWDYARRIFELWNEAYKPLYGYSELSPKQIDYYIKMYIPMLRLDLLTLVIDDNDNVVGLGITLPSLSKALKKAKGNLLPFGWIHLLKAMYGKNDIVDLYIIGVLPEYQNKGVNALIFNDLIPTYIRIGYKHAESNPELELNHKVQSQWDYVENKHHKTRRAYIKHL